MDYKMDESIQQENRRHRMDQYKGNHLPWNLVPQQNSFTVNTKLNMLYADRDSAIEERDLALSEKKAAIEARNLAIQQRDVAFSERDKAIKERDNALAALQFQEKTMMGPTSDSETTKVKRTKSVSVSVPRKSKKKKKMGEDLNKNVTTDGSKAEWDAQDFSTLNLITFDESIMAVPVCSCTGVPRHCYKWGNGGWQSSCCTTSLSQYPLPQLPHKRHARIGGRKMSGSVFTRLLTRLGAAGHDLSMAVDLKNYWAKHGTNRYITIK